MIRHLHVVVGSRDLLRGPVLSPVDSLFNAGHSPLRSSQMLVDTALKRAEVELSDAV